MVVEEYSGKLNRKLRWKKKMMKNSSSEVSSREYGLVTYEELPEYMKENEFIRAHYRSEWPLSNAFLSIFSWHNETINIWTHMIGFFVFLGFTLLHLGQLALVVDFFSRLLWSISPSGVNSVSFNHAFFFRPGKVQVLSPLLRQGRPPSSPEPADSPAAAAARWPFFVFLAGAMFCLLTSSLCHLLCCHSRRLNVLLSRLDYAGIAAMIVSSFFPPIYYIFQCTPLFQLAYLLAISSFGLLAVFALFSPELSGGRFRSHRAALFLAMGFSGLVPAVHATAANWSEPRRDLTLAYEGAMALSYTAGAMFYVRRVPERWRPGAFDLAGHSHQIFHVLVVGGALAHYAAGLVFLEYRDAVGCSIS